MGRGERNILVLPHLKILTHQAMEENVGVEWKKKSQNSIGWAYTKKKKTHKRKKTRSSSMPGL